MATSDVISLLTTEYVGKSKMFSSFVKTFFKNRKMKQPVPDPSDLPAWNRLPGRMAI